jgi:hypothetical protein
LMRNGRPKTSRTASSLGRDFMSMLWYLSTM